MYWLRGVLSYRRSVGAPFDRWSPLCSFGRYVRYERSASQLARTLDLLLDHESLVLQDAEVVRRASEALRAKPSVGLADLLILEHARQHGHTPMATFDRGFAKVDGTIRL